MKAEERQKLKANELDEAISTEIEFIKKHWRQVVSGIGACLVIISAAWWIVYFVKANRQAKIDNLQNTIVQLEIKEKSAVQNARIQPKDQQEETGQEVKVVQEDQPYDISAEVKNLGEISGKSGLGMMALIQKARALRSEVLYANPELNDQQAAEKLNQAETTYQELLSKYPNNPAAVGNAQLGLALLAEQKEQWDNAKKLYTEIAGNTSTLAGTIYPLQAERRLAVLDKINLDIKFPPAPEVKPQTPAADTQDTQKANPDTRQSPASQSTTDTAKPQPTTQPKATGKDQNKTEPEKK